MIQNVAATITTTPMPTTCSSRECHSSKETHFSHSGVETMEFQTTAQSSICSIQPSANRSPPSNYVHFGQDRLSLASPFSLLNLAPVVWCEAQIPCTSGDRHSIILPPTTLMCYCDPEASNYHSPPFRQRLLPQLPPACPTSREREMNPPFGFPLRTPSSISSRLGGP